MSFDVFDLSLKAAALVAGLGAIGWLLRKLWRAYKWAQTLGEGIDKLVTLSNSQLAANGGSSLFDKITRTDEKVDTLTTVVDGLYEKVDTLAERFESHITLQAEASLASSRAVEAAVQSSPPLDAA